MNAYILIALLALVGCTDGTMAPPTSNLCNYTCEFRARCGVVATVDTEHVSTTADQVGAFQVGLYSEGWAAACYAMCASATAKSGFDAGVDDGCFADGCTMQCTSGTTGSAQ